jgi:hypothetical protein
MAPASRQRSPRRSWRPGPGRGRKGYSELDLAALAVVVYAWFRSAWVAVAFAGVLLVVLWLAFVHPTSCDVENKNGRGSCENTAYGALRACHLPAHKRAKRDALWAYLGLRNPGRRWRIMWSRSPSPVGRHSPAPGSASPTLTRPLYDGLMLVAAVVSAAGAVIALVIDH